MNKVHFEITAINGHFERLTVYVVIYGHRIDIAYIYPTESCYELYVANGYKEDVFTFAHLAEAVGFARGIAFANGRSGYLFASEWRQAELRAMRKAYQKHKSKSL